MSNNRRLIACATLLLLAAQVASHPAPYSYLDLYVDEPRVAGSLTVHDYDAAQVLGIPVPEQLADATVVTSVATQLQMLIAARLTVTVDGQRRAIQWRSTEALSGLQSIKLQFDAGTAPRAELRIDGLLFPADNTHQTFINIHEAGRLAQQAIIEARHTSDRYYRNSLQGRWAVIQQFVLSGARHILIGPDHVLFLAGLLLIGGSLWQLLGIVTAFTVAHSVSLSLAVLGVAPTAPHIVEPLIALSIVVVGIDNLLVLQERSRAGGRAGGRDLRILWAGGFGLIHGLAFAAILTELGLPRNALAWSLASFNIGVEFGQLLIVAVLAGLLMALSARRAELIGTVRMLGSAAVAAAGLWWFVQRVWFTVGA
jgi:hypothetical protein